MRVFEHGRSIRRDLLGILPRFFEPFDSRFVVANSLATFFPFLGDQPAAIIRQREVVR